MSFGDWLDERTGHRALVRAALDEPVRGGARWAYVWGSALTLSLAVQAVTGWFLMSAYAPSATTAWASVAHIQYSLSAGWLIRGLHHFGAQAMVVILAGHLLQTALAGAYRKPREVNWYLGLGLLATTLGFALTGYLLPWDQKGYWATRVATSIAGTVPLVGGFLQRLAVGGPEYGHLTLTRFYTLHVGVLPALTVVLLAAHVALFRRHGVTPPPSADLSRVDKFYPKQVWKDLLFGLLVLLVVFALAARRHGAPLDAPADPAGDYPARPEWYFLALFELLKYFKGALEPLGAVGVPVVVLGYLVALPLIDKGSDRSLKARARFLAPLGIFALGAGLLTARSMSADASDPAFQKAREVAEARAGDAARIFQKKGVPPEGPLAMLRSDPDIRAGELFGEHCAVCHSMDLDASGKHTAPMLSGYATPGWILGFLDNPDAVFGNTPFKGQMPSMTRPPTDPAALAVWKPMTREELQAVAAFLSAQASGQRGEGMAGEVLVRRRCTACHRLDGKTDDEDSLAPELRGWASFGWIEAQIEDPGSGKAYPRGAMGKDLEGHMPAFADKISPADRKLLALWLWTRTGNAPVEQ